MAAQYFESRDAKNASLQVAISEVERGLEELPTGAGAELRVSWAKLTSLLALQPVPELRACPNCEHVGMRAATRCSYCWSKLVPPVTAEL